MTEPEKVIMEFMTQVAINFKQIAVSLEKSTQIQDALVKRITALEEKINHLVH